MSKEAVKGHACQFCTVNTGSNDFPGWILGVITVSRLRACLYEKFAVLKAEIQFCIGGAPGIQ